MTTPSVDQTLTNPKRSAKMASNQSLNHLLNFSLPPRQTGPLSNLPRRSKRAGQTQGVWNKERFINAQYRFVMNPNGDYTVHFADPDIFFQWQDIMQVLVPRSSALASAASSGQDEGVTTCPICLSPPTAPRMTRCGHVYCFPCILHYLNISENKWARCPICFDSVTEKQLKSVKWYDGPTHPPTDHAESSSSSLDQDAVLDVAPREGSSMRMRLMQRPKITTLALPRSQTWPSDLLPPHQAPFHFLPDVFNFAKFMLATPAYLVDDLTRDLDELAIERNILAGMHDALGTSFVEGAENKVRLEIAKALALDSLQLKRQIDKAIRDQQEIERRQSFRPSPPKAGDVATPSSGEVPVEFLAIKSQDQRWTSSFDGAGTPTAAIAIPHNRNTPRQRRNLNPPPPSTSTYYYYQATSGLSLYLHPLDIRIMLSHFQLYESFPDTITVQIESVSEGTVDDDLRKRCKYLAHMPEGADVVFIEADLAGVVGAEGLKNFEGPLKMRALRRKEKGRKDDRARARAEEKERERERATLASTRVMTLSEVISVPDRDSSPPERHVVESASPPQSQSPPPPSGAWGARSFASALHSSSSGRPTPNQRSSRPPQIELEDDWDIDVAWHELERNAGGRRKRGNKLVVLGSGVSGAAGRRR